LCALVVIATAPVVQAQEIVLFGAGSLREAMTQLASDYRAAQGVTVRTVFGPSGVLRERIEHGEKADLLASADIGHALTLQREGLADRVSVFARNAVCGFAPAKIGLTTETFLERLIDPAVRLGVAAANADPLGDYTQEIFRRADGQRPGSGDVLRRKAQIVTGAAPSAANTQGGAPGGGPVAALIADHKIDVYLGYCSGRQRLATALPDVQVIELPPALRVGPEYGIARLKGAAPAASDFLLHMLSLDGQKTLATHGFIPVARPAS
jgi:ABC-type molybdate transport system substrate-binding protein